MAEAFTVFEKFGDVCAELEESDRKELIYAINMYGMFGVEVELPYMLKALFISLKEDIDNSKAMRARGSKGGRPKGKPRVSESEKPEVSEDDEPVVSESCEPMVSDDSENSESQSNPNQSKPNQSKPKVRRFTPPFGGRGARVLLREGLHVRPRGLRGLLREQGVEGRQEPHEVVAGRMHHVAETAGRAKGGQP